MKKTIVIVLSIIFIIIVVFGFALKFYLPIECINGDSVDCLKKASESTNTNILKRVCRKVKTENCIILLSMLHSNSKENLIPFISDDYCNQNISAFCAFSSIAYSISGNNQSAFTFASKGCELNEGVSCAILAEIELNEERTGEALKSSLKGCLLNSAAACAIAGTILVEKGEEKDGIQFIRRCCELGGEECCE